MLVVARCRYFTVCGFVCFPSFCHLRFSVLPLEGRPWCCFVGRLVSMICAVNLIVQFRRCQILLHSDVQFRGRHPFPFLLPYPAMFYTELLVLKGRWGRCICYRPVPGVRSKFFGSEVRRACYLCALFDE